MHIKYRPKNLDEVIGNGHIKKALLSMPLTRPIMFIGSYGSGKTTFAYIVSKLFGAEGENVVDLNCVHFSKIEDMRDRIDQLLSPSVFDTKRVLILDEIHELSNKTQQILLKPLETLPKNILIIACTTETNKVISTLLDRFIKLRVYPLSYDDSMKLLTDICKKEGIEIDKSILDTIARKGNGLPRSMLTELSKLRNITDTEEINKLIELGADATSDVLQLFKCLNSNVPWDTVKTELLSLLKDNTPNSIRMGLLNLMASRITSSYYTDHSYGEDIINSYNFLKEDTVPEKAGLIMGVYNMYLNMRSK